MAALKLIAALGLFALLATIASAAVSCSADFNDCNVATFNGACYADFTSGDSYCACRSGVIGDSCETDSASANSCTLNSLNATKTEYPPISVNVLFAADRFNVTVKSPLVSQRNYTVIAIDNSSFADERCTYPGLYWERSLDSCEDVFFGSMPWADNIPCGWSADQSDVSFAKYSAQMVVRHHDVSVPFGSRPGSAPVERIVDHVVPLTISFPKNITVSSDIVVQAPIKVISAVSRQNVSADGLNANIEITTNVLWPYTLGSFTILSNPAGTGASYTPSLVSTSCANDGTSSCTQVWRISIVNGQNCNLNGDYSLQWTIDCQLVSGVKPPQCAIQTGDVATAGLTTGSENFCTVVSTILPLTGSLASYGDAGFSQNKTQFLVGQTLYYRASVVASNITLTGTTINSVKLTSSGQSTVVLQAALVTQSAGTTGEFATISSNANSATFSFKLNGAFIDAIPDDSSRTFTTIVIVDVDYLNTVTLKRGVQRIEFTSNLNNQPLGLVAAFTVDKPAGGESAAASAALSLFAAFAALAIAIAKLF